jgi:hypothetical protein
LHRRMGGPHSWFGQFGEEEDISCARIWSPDCPAHSLVTVLTVLLQLPVGWMWLNLVVHFPSDRWRSHFLDLVIWLHWLMKF